MKVFKRTSAPAARNDEHLTYFTAAQARNFRRLVEVSFSHVGRDVAVFDDHAEDRSGTVFGLWNIGALCAGADASQWPELVDDHVRRVTTPARDVADLSPGELGAALDVRLVEAAAVPDLELVDYAREVAPGLLEVLSVDLPDSVATPPTQKLRAHGPLQDLLARGRDNLRALLVEAPFESETVGTAAAGTSPVRTRSSNPAEARGSTGRCPERPYSRTPIASASSRCRCTRGLPRSTDVAWIQR